MSFQELALFTGSNIDGLLPLHVSESTKAEHTSSAPSQSFSEVFRTALSEEDHLVTDSESIVFPVGSSEVIQTYSGTTPQQSAGWFRLNPEFNDIPKAAIEGEALQSSLLVSKEREMAVYEIFAPFTSDEIAGTSDEIAGGLQPIQAIKTQGFPYFFNSGNSVESQNFSLFTSGSQSAVSENTVSAANQLLSPFSSGQGVQHKPSTLALTGLTFKNDSLQKTPALIPDVFSQQDQSLLGRKALHTVETVLSAAIEKSADERPVPQPISFSSVATGSESRVGLPSGQQAPVSAMAPYQLPNSVSLNQIGQTLIQMINKGEQHLEFRLDPPELGKLILKVSMDGESVSVQIAAGNQAAKELLLLQADRLRSALAEESMRLADLSVDLRGRDSRDSEKKRPSESIWMADVGSEPGSFQTTALQFKAHGGRLIDYFV